MPELRRGMELFRAATSRPDPDAADLKPFKPYVYRGQGYDIFADDDEPDEDGAPPFGVLDRAAAWWMP